MYQFSNPDEAFEIFYHSFLNVYNKHAPLKTKRVRDTPKQPWLTKDIQHAIDKRDSLFAEGRIEEARIQRNAVTSLKRTSKKRHFKELISSKADSKSIWSAINQLTNRKRNANTAAIKKPIPRHSRYTFFQHC